MRASRPAVSIGLRLDRGLHVGAGGKAGDAVAGRQHRQRRVLATADVHGERAARVEAAAGRRAREAGRRPGQRLARPDITDARQARDEVGGVGMERLPEESARRRLLDEPARIHDAQPVRDVGVHGEVVGHEDHRGADLALRLADHLQHVLLDDDVERGGRLVGDDELGLADGGERYRHALAHAARQLVRVGVQHVRLQVQALEMVDDDVEELVSRPVDVTGGEVDEGLPDPPHRVQHVHRALHDVGEMPPADARQLALAQLIDVAIEEAVADRAGDDVERRAGWQLPAS